MTVPVLKRPPPMQRPTGPQAPRPTVVEPQEPVEKPLTEDEVLVREIITVIAGAGAGATIGYWGFEHAFGRGMSEREKKDIGKFGLALAVLAAATHFGFKEWVTVEGIGEKADKLLSDVGV